MEEHARRYTTNQDNIAPKHISNDETSWKVLECPSKSFTPIQTMCSCCYQGFFTSGKVPLPICF